MHPAFSVIFLTTLIGVGQGLFLALYSGQIYSMMNLLPGQDSQSFYAIGTLLSLLFLAAGLVASIFHLGRPMRGWRSISQWRTSWLSREVIILGMTLFLTLLYGVAHYQAWTQPIFIVGETYPIDLSLAIGAVTMLSTFALFVCTGMIYACIKFLQEWHSPFTVINFILFGAASGFTLAAAFSAFIGSDVVTFYATWAIILTSTVFITRTASLIRNRNLKPKSNLQTAIGVRHRVISQKAQGSMCGSFNTREFFHGSSLAKLKTVKAIFLIFVFPIPIALLLATIYGFSPIELSIMAFIIQYLGLIAERWYFFTEAKHPQSLYYQSVS
jgi:DMSO reductase anchor subunit